MRLSRPALASKQRGDTDERADREIRVNLVVRCACGWVTQGKENKVIEAMQVHTRLIHGREITREEVLAEAKRSRRSTPRKESGGR